MTSLEGKLLSSVLNDKQIHVLVQGRVENYLQTHVDAWETIKNHYVKYRVVPSPELIIEKHPDFDYTANTEGTKYHFDEVQNKFIDSSVRRMINDAATAYKGGKPQQALSLAAQRVSEISRMAAGIDDVDVSQLDTAVAYYEAAKEQAELGNHGITLGLEAFDAVLPSGITDNQFGIILAFPGTGKSWLMAYMAVQAWRQGKTPLIVSLEMSESEVRNRIYAIIGQGYFSHRKLSAAKIDLDDFKRWHKMTFEGKPPIHVVSGQGSLTPVGLQGKIDQYRPDIVFVDYINLMSPNNKHAGQTERVMNLSMELKLLAGSVDVPIVAIASATPGQTDDLSLPPTMEQVAWSKQIMYDADWIIALGRTPNTDIMEVVMRKNRNGPLGEFLLQIDFDKGMFTYKGL